MARQRKRKEREIEREMKGEKTTRRKENSGWMAYQKKRGADYCGKKEDM